MDNFHLNRYFREQLILEEGSKCLEYIRNRNISLDIVKEFHLGWCPPRAHPELSGRLTVPLWNIHGEIKGFAGRFPSYKDSNGDVVSLYNSEVLQSKLHPVTNYKPLWWHQSFAKKHYLYGLKNALKHIRQAGYVIVVEGEFDLWACYQNGLRNTVAVLCSNFNMIQASRLKGLGCYKIFLMLDADEAGNLGADKSVRSLKKQDVDVIKVNLPANSDPAEFIQQHGVGPVLETIASFGD